MSEIVDVVVTFNEEASESLSFKLDFKLFFRELLKLLVFRLNMYRTCADLSFLISVYGSCLIIYEYELVFEA